MSWNVPLNSLSNHLNIKTRPRKMGLRGVLIKEENIVVIKWTFHMLTTTKDEDCIVDTNKGYTISKWNIRKQSVVLV